MIASYFQPPKQKSRYCWFNEIHDVEKPKTKNHLRTAITSHVLCFTSKFMTTTNTVLYVEFCVKIPSEKIVVHLDITSCFRVCILLGVVLLVTSTRLMRYLPRPLRRFMPGSVDRNSSLRRHGSVHATSRDSSPSAVIHATTLHHLLSSPTKEKP